MTASSQHLGRLLLATRTALAAHFPFTSKDLDLIGTKLDAERLAPLTRWKAASPPALCGPVEADLSSGPEGQGLTVEFLREIEGVPHDTILACARENLARVAG